MNIASSVITITVQFFLWKMILASNNEQYLFAEMFSYILYAQVITYFYPTNLGEQLSQMINSGDISYALLKPISLIKQLVYENFGISVYKLLFISSPVLLAGWIVSEGNLYVYDIGLFFVSFLLSYILYICIDVLFGILQFYTHSSWGVKSLKYAIITLFSGKLLPLSFYPEWCQNIFSYLPFRFLYDYPLEVIVGKNSFTEFLFIELLWVIILLLFMGFVYKISIRHLIIFGG